MDSNPSSTPTSSSKSVDGELIGDQNNIVTSISWFYNNEEMSDITLKLASRRYHAHRFVLVLMSDVFRTMCSKRWDSSKVNELELNESDQCIPVFPIFLHFLYHGTVFVNTNTALPLLMLADKYNVQPLKISCEKYIQKQVKQGNVAGAIRWLPYLQLCGHDDLEKDCIDVIVLEMEHVLTQNDFLLLNNDLLILLLGRDDLVIHTEYSLYEGVVKWIESHEGGDASRQQYLQSLLPMLRFSMMFPEQLLSIENSEFYRLHQELMSPYLALAHRFRSLASEVTDETFSGLTYRPRNYTHGVWCQFTNLEADGVSFFSKSITLPNAYDLLSGSLLPQETNWQLQVVTEKRDNSSSSKLISASVGVEGGQWRLGSPNTFSPALPSPNPTIPLQLSVRPLKPIRPNMLVEVSLFMLKKNNICKHLDSTVISARDGAHELATMKGQGKNFLLRLHQSRSTPDKVFQPSPMHFAFNPPHIMKEPENVLRYRFNRDDLEHPPEVACFSIGPHFGAPARPYQNVKVAVIMKPRFKSQLEETDQFMPGVGAPGEGESEPSEGDDGLPIYG